MFNQLRTVCAPTVFGFLFVSIALAVNPVPTVTGPTHPQTIMPGSGPLTLTVYGANFVSGAVVNWNGSPRSTTFVSARELHAQILASDVAKNTAGMITVTNPKPGGGPSSSSFATVEVHAPTKTINLAKPTLYVAGVSILYPSIGDFYNHQRPDLLGAGGGTIGRVYLLKNKANGTFPSTRIAARGYDPSGCSSWPTSTANGDFNNDGNLDFLYSTGVGLGPQTLRVRLGDGQGHFQKGYSTGPFEVCPNYAVGDFNQDGNLDFAALSDCKVRIYLGHGDGTFQLKASYKNSGCPFDPATADFNGDGKLDLVFDTGNGIELMLGNGDGTFQKPKIIVANRSGEGGAACGFGVPFVVDDFNADGKLDIGYCSGAYSDMGIALGNGDGTFQKPVHYHAGTNYTGWVFATGDFNGDGFTDIVVWYFTQNPDYHAFLGILKGKGDGTFQKETNVNLPNKDEETGILAGDFNSDGLLDLVMQDVGGGVLVFLNK